MHHQISPKHSVATTTVLCTAMATALRWHALRIAVAGGLALFWLTGASAASAPTPCCGVTNIAKNGEITARETNGARTFQFQVADPALRSKLRVGSPVYANFDTKQVSLDGKKSCCTILNISTAAKQLVPGTTPAAPKNKPSGTTAPNKQTTTVQVPKVDVTASEGSTATAIRGRPATPTTAAKQPAPGTTPANPGGSATTQAVPFLLKALQVNPTGVAGGNRVLGTVELVQAPGPNGVTVTLESSNPQLAGVPPRVTITHGVTSAETGPMVKATFPIETHPVQETQIVTIKAHVGVQTLQANLYIKRPGMKYASLVPPSICGGGNKGTVKYTLTGPAPSGLKVSASVSGEISGSTSETVPTGNSAGSMRMELSRCNKHNPGERCYMYGSVTGQGELAAVSIGGSCGHPPD